MVFTCVLLLACAFSGCIGSDDDDSADNTTDKYDPVTTVNVQKRGIVLAANEVIQIILPENAAGGYLWIVSDIDGLIVEESVSASENGSRTKVFNVTAERAGYYIFEALYIHNSRDFPTYTFTQGLDYASPIADPPEEPGLIMDFAGIPTPKAGSIIEVRARGNPSTGYTLDVQMTHKSHLQLLDVQFIRDEGGNETDGSDGTYVWYLTSDVPGTYMFDVFMSTGAEDPTALFYIDLTFT
ncbi:protease inhibitor I42 family protein [Methanimicrococcus hongohii]|uniref:protease inhibitor I42 family protein n=1 Tax=Methanimicrococcus hongohii TaxID=3028295 RepID=UPI00292FD7F9|nr:protease inhibitor I42 family protein [Methanimicrococcus sp. Hf6]